MAESELMKSVSVIAELKSCKRGFYLEFSFYVSYSDSTVSEEAGIELRTASSLVLTARRSNHSVRSHPPLG